MLDDLSQGPSNYVLRSDNPVGNEVIYCHHKVVYEVGIPEDKEAVTNMLMERLGAQRELDRPDFSSDDF